MYIKETTKLRDHQKEQVKQLIGRRRALLDEKCGAGKTLTCLYAFAFLKYKQKIDTMIVFTPLSAYSKLVWKRDADKFTGLRCIDLDTLYEKTKSSDERLDKYLKAYDIIYAKHSHVKTVATFIAKVVAHQKTLVVLDEVHAFKNPKAKQTILMKMAIVKAYGLWGLTATPLSRNLEDTYNIINFIRPWFLGGFISFRTTYCKTENKVIGYDRVLGRAKTVEVITGVKNEEAFQEKISHVVIKGNAFLTPKFHYVDYKLSDYEKNIYMQIARGIDMDSEMDGDAWLQSILSQQQKTEHNIKNVDKYSTRFIYLQTAADGVINTDGTQNRVGGTKTSMTVDLIQKIVAKKESVLVYFDYYATLEVVEKMLKESKIQAIILKSTGEHVLDAQAVTEAKVKQRSYIILCTKAASESVSYYFINNVVFVHVPTVPSTMVQMVGRIVRMNTLYPDDLNIYIFRSENIDLYKLYMVSIKSYQMELVAGEEKNIPPTYKGLATEHGVMEKCKKLLLWNNQKL